MNEPIINKRVGHSGSECALRRRSWVCLAGLLALGIGSSAAAQQQKQAASPQKQQAAAPQQQPPTPQQRVENLKQWLQYSQKQMRAYVWVETTTVSKDGEVKSKDQKKCFYAPDGTLQKVPISQESSDSSGPPGILPAGKVIGKLAEHKQEEAKQYMKDVVDLVHSYLPPNQGLIQQAVNSGNVGVDMVKPGSLVRINFANYLKKGDQLAVDVNPSTNQLLGMHVKTYLDSPDDAVQLDSSMAVLPDGTIYMQQATLQAPSKGLTVTIQNANYVKSGG